MGDEYFEYLPRNPSYMGEKLFIMHRIKQWELRSNVDYDAMQTYNKMHACF